jgi:predicted nucleic acid-binding protein
MIRAFVDSSVFFAACLSGRGASRELLREATRGTILLVISELVRAETEKNLREAVPHVLPSLSTLFDAVPFTFANPSIEEIAEAATYTFPKDAPIVAAARKAHVDYLVSLDRKHLVGIAEVAQGSDLAIVLPEVVLDAIRKVRKARSE